MACNDSPFVSLSIAQPGDVSLIWIEECPPGHYVSGTRVIIEGSQVEEKRPISESELTPANPLRYVYKPNQLYVVTLIFDPVTGPGRAVKVHGNLRRNLGTVHSWCATVNSGTPEPDYASYGLKAAQ